MPHTTREETQEGQRFRRAILPTLNESLVLLIGSFLFLVAINAIPAFRNNVDGQEYSMFSDFMKSNAERLLAPTNNQQGSTILTIALWMVVGIIAYVVVTIIVSTVRAYRSDVKITRDLILPQGVSASKSSHEFFLRLLVRLFATIMFLYWLYLIFASILPYTSDLIINNLGTWTVSSVSYVLLAPIVLAASIFMTMIYARCIVLRERVFNS